MGRSMIRILDNQEEMGVVMEEGDSMDQGEGVGEGDSEGGVEGHDEMMERMEEEEGDSDGMIDHDDGSDDGNMEEGEMEVLMMDEEVVEEGVEQEGENGKAEIWGEMLHTVASVMRGVVRTSVGVIDEGEMMVGEEEQEGMVESTEDGEEREDVVDDALGGGDEEKDVVVDDEIARVMREMLGTAQISREAGDMTRGVDMGVEVEEEGEVWVEEDVWEEVEAKDEMELGLGLGLAECTDNLTDAACVNVNVPTAEPMVVIRASLSKQSKSPKPLFVCPCGRPCPTPTNTGKLSIALHCIVSHEYYPLTYLPHPTPTNTGERCFQANNSN